MSNRRRTTYEKFLDIADVIADRALANNGRFTEEDTAHAQLVARFLAETGNGGPYGLGTFTVVPPEAQDRVFAAANGSLDPEARSL